MTVIVSNSDLTPSPGSTVALAEIDNINAAAMVRMVFIVVILV
ncbi:MAG: hypothetical protein ACI837_001430 [Crocinitomicaceae bacterium]